MNKLRITLVLLIISLVTLSCSNDDNSGSSKKLNELEKKLIATWHVSPEKNENRYTYYADGTSLYEIYFNPRTTGKSDSSEKGVWEIIDGNTLIEYYFDKGEPWDDNWREYPTIKSKVQFTDNDNVLLRSGSPLYKE